MDQDIRKEIADQVASIHTKLTGGLREMNATLSEIKVYARIITSLCVAYALWVAYALIR